MSEKTPIVLATARREAELLALARQLGPSEFDFLLYVARDLIARRAAHGPLHVNDNVRDLRTESVEAIAHLLLERVNAAHGVARLAAAVLLGLAGHAAAAPPRRTRRPPTPLVNP